MALAEDFQEVLDSLPGDWTDIVCDLRLADEDRYIDAAVLLTHGQRPAVLEGRLALPHQRRPLRSATPRPPRRSRERSSCSTSEGIEGELIVRDFHEGRAEVVQMWGRPESVRREFRARRAL